MTKRPQDTSAEEPDGGNPHIRFRGGPGLGNQPGLLNNASRLQFVFALLLGITTMVPLAQAADEAPSRVVGHWLTEPRDGIIQITVDATGNLEGRIVGGNHPGLKDEKNPDPARRGAALRGQLILKAMKYDGDGHWSGGTIYKPDNGKTYKCKVEFEGKDTLEVRGFIGFSLFGITQNWTRYTGISMDLPPTH